MTFQDKTIQCSDCGATFTFDAAEQEQYASRGYTNDPKRCPPCRQTRKSQQPENSGRAYGTGTGYTSDRQMFPARCAQCGKETQVPFEPRSGRPVYCSDCYRKVKPSRY